MQSAAIHWVRLHWTRSEGLAIFASGRLHHLLKIGQPLKTICVWDKVKQPLAKFFDWLALT